MDRLRSFDARALGLQVLDTPSGKTLRRLEHAIALYVLYRAGKAVVTLGPSGIKKAITGLVLKGVRRVPALASKVREEEDAIFEEVERDLLKILPDAAAHTKLPEHGTPAAEVVAECLALRQKETEFLSGIAHAGIYYEAEDEELHTVHDKVMTTFLSSNMLFPGVFTSVRKFEAEIVAMVVAMLHGDTVGACGSLTSGGSESILMAVKAYRDYAEKVKGITAPEVVAGVTAHPALDKACHYLKVKLVKVPVDPVTQRLTAASVVPFITRNTIFVYASAPTFPHGVVDDVEGISAVTAPRGLGLHVDNCLGGFLLSHLQAIGAFTRPFDFEVPGVTTISTDVHKFGLSPKGASVVTYRSSDLRKFQYHSTVDFAGGLYATPTAAGSRPGGAIAATWATMVHIGREGYIAHARQFAAATDAIVAGLRSMPGLRLLCQPDAAIIAFTSDVYDIFSLIDRVHAKGGWELSGLQNPSGAAIRLGGRMLGSVHALLADIKEAAEFLTAHPTEVSKGAVATMYGTSKMLPAEDMEGLLARYIDLLYKVKPAGSAAAK